jgi:Raf kinase inhibitor-like YbhB/YbcL family protein
MRRAALALVVVAAVVAACSSSEPSPSSSREVVGTALAATTPASIQASASAPPAPSASVTKEAAVPLVITSSAFAEGEAIPPELTCDGGNISPPLGWSGVPAGTVVLALIVDDPDAGGFIHWVVYDIDPAVAGLAQGESTSKAGDAPSQGQNSFGKIGYGGPCPPSGSHHYVFRLLALDQRVELRTGGVATAGRILDAAVGHTLAEARLTATYRRR